MCPCRSFSLYTLASPLQKWHKTAIHVALQLPPPPCWGPGHHPMSGWIQWGSRDPERLVNQGPEPPSLWDGNGWALINGPRLWFLANLISPQAAFSLVFFVCLFFCESFDPWSFLTLGNLMVNGSQSLPSSWSLLASSVVFLSFCGLWIAFIFGKVKLS